jgi:predicted Rossmann-fold nucleotide-binding protein
MAQYADALILFPGGRGTADMKARAVKHGLNIVEWAEIKGEGNERL